MAYSPVGNRVVLELLRVEGDLLTPTTLYTGWAKVIAGSNINFAVSEGDIVLTPHEYQDVPGEKHLIVAKIEDISAKKV